MGKINIKGWSMPPTKSCDPETNDKLRVEFNFRTELRTRRLTDCSLDIFYPKQIGSSIVQRARDRTDRNTFVHGGPLIQLHFYEHTPVCRLDINGISKDGRCKWCINFRKMLEDEAKFHSIGYEEVRCCMYGSADKYDVLR